MESHLIALSRYRMERAAESLLVAEETLSSGHYRESLNRSYYAVFYAICATNSVNGFDSRKHSGVISYFIKTFLKSGSIGFSKEMSAIIRDTRLLREKSDYQDFFEASKSDAEEQLANAKRFVETVSAFLADKLTPDA